MKRIRPEAVRQAQRFTLEPPDLEEDWRLEMRADGEAAEALERAEWDREQPGA